MVAHLAQHVVVVACAVRVQVFVALQNAATLLIFVENRGYLHLLVLFGDAQCVVGLLTVFVPRVWRGQFATGTSDLLVATSILGVFLIRADCLITAVYGAARSPADRRAEEIPAAA